MCFNNKIKFLAFKLKRLFYLVLLLNASKIHNYFNAWFQFLETVDLLLFFIKKN